MARKPDVIVINKKQKQKKKKNLRNRRRNQQKKKKRTCEIVDFAVPAGYKIKLKESQKKDKYLDFAWELKKTMENEGDDYSNYDWCFWHSN